MNVSSLIYLFLSLLMQMQRSIRGIGVRGRERREGKKMVNFPMGFENVE